ncbi:MAG: type I-E CRISPR-associated protein Cas6/Cse3/CasE [Wenzhouxiangellaceae bacterium]
MNGLQMIECHLDQTALLRFLRGQGLDHPRHGPDLGYGVHAWLKAAFGDLAPRPWRLLADRRRPARVLGYGAHGADALREHLRTFGPPQVEAICPPDTIASKPMPDWRRGQRLDFEVLLCPVGRKSGSGIEKDLFLLQADHAPDEKLDRARIYGDWLQPRLEENGACRVERIWLQGFRRTRQQRKSERIAGQRQIARLERPEALLAGTLSIEDPAAFSGLLARGIGRHRAFGYGMLLLKPATG